MKTKRPNDNEKDACCRCGKLAPTPKDVDKPGAGDLRVHHDDASAPPQWVCPACEKEIGS